MQNTKNIFGLIGIVIALAGVSVAVFQDHLRPSPEPVSVNLGEAALAKGKQWLGVESEGIEEEKFAFDWITVVQFGLGFIGITLGAVSWIRNENHRVSALAAALGLVVVAWEYVLIAVGVAVLMLILGSFA